MNHPHVPDVSPDLPSRGWRLTLAALKRLPQGALSRGFGRVADTPIPRPLRRVILGNFARMLGIDESEAEHPIDQYGSLNEFFVRRLKRGARMWPDAGKVGSPVEAVAGQLGMISNGTLVQAKGRSYSVKSLLEDELEAARYEGGSFITLYLSPRHYHRIHAPMAGSIPKARHVPGKLLPVNAAAVLHVPSLFAVNERLICYLDSAAGRIAVVAVGAYNVGRISAAFEPGWTTNRRKAGSETHTYETPVSVRVGEEIMAFHLGSTVVALFEPGVRLFDSIEPGQEIRLGQPIASS
jgi:phosphatidylserine decarboxylase